METNHTEKVMRAISLVEKGFATAYKAAKIVGISSSTLYKSKQYQQIKPKKKNELPTKLKILNGLTELRSVDPSLSYVRFRWDYKNKSVADQFHFEDEGYDHIKEADWLHVRRNKAVDLIYKMFHEQPWNTINEAPLNQLIDTEVLGTCQKEEL